MLGYGDLPGKYPNELPRVLSQLGYHTEAIGKLHFGWNYSAATGNKHGFHRATLYDGLGSGIPVDPTNVWTATWSSLRSIVTVHLAEFITSYIVDFAIAAGQAAARAAGLMPDSGHTTVGSVPDDVAGGTLDAARRAAPPDWRSQTAVKTAHDAASLLARAAAPSAASAEAVRKAQRASGNASLPTLLALWEVGLRRWSRASLAR